MLWSASRRGRSRPRSTSARSAEVPDRRVRRPRLSAGPEASSELARNTAGPALRGRPDQDARPRPTGRCRTLALFSEASTSAAGDVATLDVGDVHHECAVWDLHSSYPDPDADPLSGRQARELPAGLPVAEACATRTDEGECSGYSVADRELSCRTVSEVGDRDREHELRSRADAASRGRLLHRQLCARRAGGCARTVNVELALPAGVVTVTSTAPGDKPSGTTVLISVSETTVTGAFAPSKLTADVSARPVPMMSTGVPGAPSVGVMVSIVGGASGGLARSLLVGEAEEAAEAEAGTGAARS